MMVCILSHIRKWGLLYGSSADMLLVILLSASNISRSFESAWRNIVTLGTWLISVPQLLLLLPDS